jgi:hypothetical protein
MMRTADGRLERTGAAGAVFLASALVLALQIAFIRILTLDTYHHFTYLVISTALLGFGASGTLLSIARRHVERHFALWGVASLLALAVGSAVAYRIAVVLRPDLQYVLFSGVEMLKLWAHTLVLFLPFFAGGLFVGMILSRFSSHAGLVYGSNMVGSGLGGVSGVLLAFLVSPYRMPAVLATLALGALLVWIVSRPELRSGRLRGVSVAAVAVSALVVAGAALAPVESSVDQYKALAHAQRLEKQGDAHRLARVSGPRARIDVYDVPSMHHTLFAAPTAPTPPSQLSLFLDGSHAGGIFRIREAEEAPVLRHVAQSLAYRLVAEPRVLILGGHTGVNAWLALLHGAREVTVVQPNPRLTETVRRVVGTEAATQAATKAGGRSAFDHPAVDVVHTEPRHFLERTEEEFDIIHLAEAEGMPAGSGGLASMREDYLLTTEAVQLAVGTLTPEGLLTVTRGMQSPPRDNLRLFALFEAALRRGEAGSPGVGGRGAAGSRGEGGSGAAGDPGASTPGARLLQARNYLAVTTIAAAQALEPERIRAFRRSAAALSMDPDYFPGIAPEDLTERNRVPGPEGEPGSYYYHGARRILAGESERERFFSEWVYTIRPPSDERPYFHSFFKWDSLDRYVRDYGRFWFRRLELGYAVVVITFVQVVLAALVLVLAPILVLRSRHRRAATESPKRGTSSPIDRPRIPGVPWTVLHFTAIGLGFLLIEMLHIQRFTRFLGDPIYATAAVLTSILVASGVGSYTQGHIAARTGLTARARIRWGGLAVAVLAVLYYLGLDPVLALAVEAGEAVRFAVTLVLLVPLSFALGWLMPAGLELAGTASGNLVPLAWAVNGVASVAATPLSVMIAAGSGFAAVTVVASGCYLLAALAVSVPRY